VIRSAFGDELAGAEEAFEGAGVGPPAFEGFAGEVAAVEVVVVDVGDFEFTSAAGLEVFADFEGVAVVEVDACHSHVAGRLFGLFDEAFDFAFAGVAVELDDAEALRIGDFFQDDLCAGLLREEVGGGFAHVAFDDVVTEDDADLAAIGEVFGEFESIGDAAFAFLVAVAEGAQAQVLAVFEELEEVAGVFAAGHDHDFIDACVDEALDGVVDHGPVVDGQQVLVGDKREGAQTCAQTTGENDTLHGKLQKRTRQSETKSGGARGRNMQTAQHEVRAA